MNYQNRLLETLEKRALLAAGSENAEVSVEVSAEPVHEISSAILKIFDECVDKLNDKSALIARAQELISNSADGLSNVAQDLEEAAPDAAEVLRNRAGQLQGESQKSVRTTGAVYHAQQAVLELREGFIQVMEQVTADDRNELFQNPDYIAHSLLTRACELDQKAFTVKAGNSGIDLAIQVVAKQVKTTAKRDEAEAAKEGSVTFLTLTMLNELIHTLRDRDLAPRLELLQGITDLVGDLKTTAANVNKELGRPVPEYECVLPKESFFFDNEQVDSPKRRVISPTEKAVTLVIVIGLGGAMAAYMVYDFMKWCGFFAAHTIGPKIVSSAVTAAASATPYVLPLAQNAVVPDTIAGRVALRRSMANPNF